MATRCTVSLWESDTGLYRTVYGHWDGYLSQVGRILLENYTSSECVLGVIKEGDFSKLGPTIDETIFYSRDKGESYELVSPRVSKSIADIEKQDYNYLFNGKKWFYFKEDRILKPLTENRINNER